MGHSPIKDKLISAVIAGAEVVRADQGLPTQSRLKTEDGTLVTPTDLRSQRAMLAEFEQLPGFDLVAEEAKLQTAKSDDVIFIDPMDGTGAFAGGLSTSTTIAAHYSRKDRRLKAAAICEPATRRVWYADIDSQTKVIDPRHGTLLAGAGWPDRAREFGPKDYVYLDVAHGFKQVSNQVMAKFLGYLAGSGIKLHVPGSNGLIQAIVANGAASAAGSISTAKGGPYDFCGALLVKQAGGFVRGYQWQGTKLAECDGLDPVACDFLITANSSAIVLQLCEALTTAVNM